MSGSKIHNRIREILSGSMNQSGSRMRIQILCMGCIVAVIGAFFGSLWLLRGGENRLPQWIEWKNGTFLDVSGKYEILLKRKSVKVMCDTNVIWTTPRDVKVQDAMSCDIDGDGTDELVLLCWKVGRFGASKPFWVEEDEKTWSQHIFVYSYDQESVKPKWMSSYIGVDVVEISATAPGNGQNGSAASDGVAQNGGTHRQRLLLTDTDGRMSSWIWDSWGFTKEDTDISFVVLGDNLIHEPIYQYGLHKSDENFDFLFEDRDIKELIHNSDVAVINQETPFTDQPSQYSSFPRFGTPVGVGEAIKNAGFDVVTCATNHALDQGVAGVSFTKGFFNSRDILCIGIQSEDEKEYRPYEILVRGSVRFALFNYTYGTNGNQTPEDKAYMVHLLGDEEQIRADLEKARAETDFVLVFVHWGTEYSGQPDEFQHKWAQIFLENGVDAVVGTHPHALQPYEILRDESGHEMLVYYSIGNYISAQQEKSCVKGGAAQFTVSLTPAGYRITEYTLRPLEISWQEDGKYTVEFSEESLVKISGKISPNL